ncbi:AsnC family transcriptional regulator [Novosphingobium panipatense]
MSTPNLDDLDRQMIEILSRDARVSNRKIAAELGSRKEPCVAASSGCSRTG